MKKINAQLIYLINNVLADEQQEFQRKIFSFISFCNRSLFKGKSRENITFRHNYYWLFYYI